MLSKNVNLLFIFLLLLLNCNDRDTNEIADSFCSIQRNYDSTVENKEGTLVFLQDKSKYAIRFYPNLPTIDEVDYYVLCEKPENISEDDSVKFSCDLYDFNSNEGYSSAIGGAEFYFANDLSIIKL